MTIRSLFAVIVASIMHSLSFFAFTEATYHINASIPYEDVDSIRSFIFIQSQERQINFEADQSQLEFTPVDVGTWVKGYIQVTFDKFSKSTLPNHRYQ